MVLQYFRDWLVCNQLLHAINGRCAMKYFSAELFFRKFYHLRQYLLMLQSVPGIVTFISKVSCSNLYKEILFYNVYKMIFLISMCVWERTPASVLRAPASACALNSWWILNISGSDKVKEKEKKISVWYHCLRTSQSLDTHGSTFTLTV